MRKTILPIIPGALILALAASLAIADGDPVFTPTWMTVYGTATFRGAPPERGDEVRAYSPDGRIVGRFKVEKGGTEDYGFMPVYGDDAYSPAKDGAVAGEAIRFVFFKANEAKEYPLVRGSIETVTFSATAEEIRLDLMF